MVAADIQLMESVGFVVRAWQASPARGVTVFALVELDCHRPNPDAPPPEYRQKTTSISISLTLSLWKEQRMARPRGDVLSSPEITIDLRNGHSDDEPVADGVLVQVPGGGGRGGGGRVGVQLPSGRSDAGSENRHRRLRQIEALHQIKNIALPQPVDDPGTTSETLHGTEDCRPQAGPWSVVRW